MSAGEPSAAQRYREIVAGLDDAARNALARDRERAAELAGVADARHDELLRSGERAALSRAAVALRWESAVTALWAERWFMLRMPPEPDGHARPEHLDSLDRAVEDTHEQLLAAIRRGRWGWRRS